VLITKFQFIYITRKCNMSTGGYRRPKSTGWNNDSFYHWGWWFLYL